MNKLLLPHHSTPDWDFQFENYEITPAQFVSPPTSLRGLQLGSNAVLCRHPATLDLKKGWITTYAYRRRVRAQRVLFLNDAPLGTAGFGNLYSWGQADLTYAQLIRWEEGNPVVLSNDPMETTLYQWYHFRVRWEYIDVEPGRKDLYVIGEMQVAGEWVIITDYIDPDVPLPLRDVNRVGHDAYGYSFWIDDTRIWGDL